jgi:hypothetical protein
MIFNKATLMAIAALMMMLVSISAVKKKHDETGTEVIRIVNSMLKVNALPETRQIAHCFSAD